MRLKKNYVFTYGTLMKGEVNHYKLRNAEYVCDGVISGYKMFNLDCFPAIKESEGTVLGELYLVSDELLKELDYFEGEGSLYIRKTTKVYSLDKEYEAYVYVYNKESNNKYLGNGLYSYKTLKDEYVWYVSYGSNLCLERFLIYITSGRLDKYNVEANGCHDIS